MKQAHGGIGASSHMACLLFTAEIGAKPTLVAYRGSGPALNDLVGGHVDFLCEQSVSVAESVLAGSVKAYAVSAAERLATLPDVPTAKEAGVNYEMSVWAGLFAPKGAPPEVIAKLADALDKALDEPAVRERTGPARRLDTRQGRAQPGGIRPFCSVRNRALGAYSRRDPERRNEAIGTCNVAPHDIYGLISMACALPSAQGSVTGQSRRICSENYQRGPLNCGHRCT